jgi:hypothetical protein
MDSVKDWELLKRNLIKNNIKYKIGQSIINELIYFIIYKKNLFIL